MKTILIAIITLCATPLFALDVQQVQEEIYAIVGDTGQRSAENLGNNATFGVVVTSKGVVLIDAGGSWLGAAAIDEKIKWITDQPVVMVINTGGQDHRWLGNGYWQAQGAQIIASAAAVADQRERGSQQMTVLANFLGEGLEGTEPVYADRVFDSDISFTFGNVDFEIHHAGQAHTPGDSFVWLPQTEVMFAGDIVYFARILGVGPQSHSGSWIEVFETMASYEPESVVPGHGSPTTLQLATEQTYDYLVNLRTQMGIHIDEGGDIIGSVDVDQSAFSYLINFDGLSRRNAQQVFEEMEWE